MQMVVILMADGVCDDVDDCVGSPIDCAEDIVCTDLPVSDNTFYVDSDGTVYIIMRHLLLLVFNLLWLDQL